MNDNYILKLNYKTNLNMRDLGKELDVSLSTLNRYKTGNNFPKYTKGTNSSLTFEIESICSYIKSQRHYVALKKKPKNDDIKRYSIILKNRFNKLLISKNELAQLLNVSTTSIEDRIQKRNNCPSYIKLGDGSITSTLKFSIVDVARYLLSIDYVFETNEIDYERNLDTVKFSIGGNHKSNIIDYFESNGYKFFTKRTNYELSFIFCKMPNVEGPLFKLYYSANWDLTIIEFYGLKSYKDSEVESKNVLNLFYEYLKVNDLENSTSLTKIDVAYDFKYKCSQLEIIDLVPRNPNQNINDDRFYENCTYYSKGIDFHKCCNIHFNAIEKEFDFMEDIMDYYIYFEGVNIRFNQYKKDVYFFDRYYDIYDEKEWFDNLIRTNKSPSKNGFGRKIKNYLLNTNFYIKNDVIFVKSSFVDSNHLQFRALREVDKVKFKIIKSNNCCLYDKANKAGLNYDLSRVEFSIVLPKKDRISFIEYMDGKWQDILTKRLSNYLVFVDNKVATLV